VPGRKTDIGAETARGPKALQIRLVAAEPKPEDDDLPEDAVLIPAGSILRGVLLSGMDAPTGKQSRRDPYPALARIKHDAILPNRFRLEVRKCFLVLAGYGDLTSERAYLRTEAITCVREDGAPSMCPSTPMPPAKTARSGCAGAW
jgi:conjugal transfer pilus assembly protein TraB